MFGRRYSELMYLYTLNHISETKVAACAGIEVRPLTPLPVRRLVRKVETKPYRWRRLPQSTVLFYSCTYTTVARRLHLYLVDSIG